MTVNNCCFVMWRNFFKTRKSDILMETVMKASIEDLNLL